jgi:hypothetical protein
MSGNLYFVMRVYRMWVNRQDIDEIVRLCEDHDVFLCFVHKFLCHLSIGVLGLIPLGLSGGK